MTLFYRHGDLTPLSLAPDLAGRVEVPSYTSNGTALPKWTIVNDEWVQVLCEIQRGPKGLSDRPAALSAMAQIGVVP